MNSGEGWRAWNSTTLCFGVPLIGDPSLGVTAGVHLELCLVGLGGYRPGYSKRTFVAVDHGHVLLAAERCLFCLGFFATTEEEEEQFRRCFFLSRLPGQRKSTTPKNKGGKGGESRRGGKAMVSLYCSGAPPSTEPSQPTATTRPGGGGGVKIFSLLGLLVGLPAPTPDPLLTLLRAKIENKVTRPLVTRRLSISGAFSSLDFTAASRAKIGGAPAAVSNF